MPPEMHRYALERCSEFLAPVRHKFVQAGLAGHRFTEKAHDMPMKRLNYSFDRRGKWVFDWDSKRDTGETIMSYCDFETG